MKSMLRDPLLRHCSLLLLMPFFVVAFGRSQPDTVHVTGDNPPGSGNLNKAVQSAIAAGKLSSTVFRLDPSGTYLLNGGIIVPAGSRLMMVAPEPGMTQSTAPPRILWMDSTALDTRIMFDCFGDITMKNVWLLYATAGGIQVGTGLRVEDTPDTIQGQHARFDGVLFDYSCIPWDAGGAVTVASRHFKGEFQNCFFRNCVDQVFTYWGKAVSFPLTSPGWHVDSIAFENCTFANLGYAYAQADGEFSDVVRFNHCTFLNVMMSPLGSGSWHGLSVTNCLFVNPFLFGDSRITRMWPDSTEPYGGTLRIDSIAKLGFPVPFTEHDRHILFSHSGYFIEEWVRTYMASMADTSGDYSIDVRPQPRLSPGTLSFFDGAVNGVKSFPFINKAHLFDSTDPGFNGPLTNLIGIKRFLWMNWFDAEDTTWAFHPEDDISGLWPLKGDLSYTNSTLLSAGMDGFPLGDLYHWFPSEYVHWVTQAETEHARITSWLATGTDPGGPDAVQTPSDPASPFGYVLSQNYPNPFNPKTLIRYTVGGTRGHLPAGQPASGLAGQAGGLGTSDVRLVVYDVLGREVAVLVNDKQTAGTYEAEFDGARLASGVYVYRLTGGAYSAARKMLLVR